MAEEGWQLWQRLPTTMSRRALIPVIYATCPHTHASAHTHTHTQRHTQPHLHKFCNRQKQKNVKKEQRNREGSLTVNALRLTEHERGRREGGWEVEEGRGNTSYGVRLLSKSLAKFKPCLLLCKRNT